MKRIITLSLSFVMLIVVCLSAVGCATQSKTNEIDLPETVHNQTENEEITEYKISLASSGPVTQSEDYVAKTLIATVYPQNALNKSVTWSIRWEYADDKADVNISDYYEVIPSSEGSNIAEVRCYARPEFDNGNAVVTVTTVEGSFEASCLIKFVGLPSSMSVSNCDIIMDGEISSSITENSEGVFYTSPELRLSAVGNAALSYKFKIDFSNLFGYVGTAKDCTFEVVSLTGKIITQDAEANKYYTTLEYTGHESVKNFADYESKIDISIEGDYLIVTPRWDAMYTVKTTNVAMNPEYHDLFYSISPNEDAVITIKITNSTGLTETVVIDFVAGVSRVTVDQTEILF